ncbi:MAG: type II toxin-antitoxin system HicB family antitoxin [Dehalococcoidia bacterium]|nr:type II toxin-antitoxin system HicB family antitoxin [Dehalococcoidia bacterium]
MKGYEVEAQIKPWDEGSYLVEIPALQGCWCVIKARQTVAKALEDIREVAEMAIAARLKEGKSLPAGLKSASDGGKPLRITLTVPMR